MRVLSPSPGATAPPVILILAKYTLHALLSSGPVRLSISIGLQGLLSLRDSWTVQLLYNILEKMGTPGS
jgi:hypothetical protein